MVKVDVEVDMDLLVFGAVLECSFWGCSSYFVVSAGSEDFTGPRKRQVGSGGGVGTR